MNDDLQNKNVYTAPSVVILKLSITGVLAASGLIDGDDNIIDGSGLDGLL